MFELTIKRATLYIGRADDTCEDLYRWVAGEQNGGNDMNITMSKTKGELDRPVCNICGKPLDIFDESEGFAICKHLGYGTAYDGDDLDFHTCCACMDKIIKMCKVSPIK